MKETKHKTWRNEKNWRSKYGFNEEYDIFSDDEFIDCPVCGRPVLEEDICFHCWWENTGKINIDGGPNKMTLAEAREAYAKGLPINGHERDEDPMKPRK